MGNNTSTAAWCKTSSTTATLLDSEVRPKIPKNTVTSTSTAVKHSPPEVETTVNSEDDSGSDSEDIHVPAEKAIAEEGPTSPYSCLSTASPRLEAAAGALASADRADAEAEAVGGEEDAQVTVEDTASKIECDDAPAHSSITDELSPVHPAPAAAVESPHDAPAADATFQGTEASVHEEDAACVKAEADEAAPSTPRTEVAPGDEPSTEDVAEQADADGEADGPHALAPEPAPEADFVAEDHAEATANDSVVGDVAMPASSQATPEVSRSAQAPTAPTPAPAVALRSTPVRASPPAPKQPAEWLRSGRDVGSAWHRAVRESTRKTQNASRQAYTSRVLPLPVLSWVSAVTGAPVPESATSDESGAQDFLESGVVLCELANRIRPGAVASIERKSFPFAKRQNVENFLAFAQSLGLKGNEVFRAEELIDGTDMARVFVCIAAVGRASYDLPGFEGPKFSRVHQQAFNFVSHVNAGR